MPRDDPPNPLEAEIIRYNQSHRLSPIRFIHGGSSAAFAFFGQKVRVINQDDQIEERTIPRSLIPSGILRKYYGVYPFSGENDLGTYGLGGGGSRRSGINYSSISGMRANQRGIDTALSYAERYAAPTLSIEDLDKQIKDLILKMTPGNYLRSLKKLLQLINNMMLIAPIEGNANVRVYKKLLLNEYSVLSKNKEIDLFSLERHFGKYLNRFMGLFDGRDLALKSTPELLRQLTEAFPIIYCSTKEGLDFDKGVVYEQVYKGELSLSHVAMVFTPKEHVAKLRNLLQEHNLTHIEVRGYDAAIHSEEQVVQQQAGQQIVPEIIAAAKATKTVENVRLFVTTYKDTPLFEELLYQIMNRAISDYIKTGSQDNRALALWITQNTTLLNQFSRYNYGDGIIEARLLSHSAKFLADKTTVHPQYLDVLEEHHLIEYPQEQLARACYFNEHEEFQDSFYDKTVLLNSIFNYSSPISEETMANVLLKREFLINDHIILKRIESSIRILSFDLKNCGADAPEKNIIETSLTHAKSIYVNYILTVLMTTNPSADRSKEYYQPLIDSPIFQSLKTVILERSHAQGIPIPERLKAQFSSLLHVSSDRVAAQEQSGSSENSEPTDTDAKQQFLRELKLEIVKIRQLKDNDKNKYHLKSLAQLGFMLQSETGSQMTVAAIIKHWKKATCDAEAPYSNDELFRQIPLTNGNFFSFLGGRQVSDVQIVKLVNAYSNQVPAIESRSSEPSIAPRR
jgi:hypothetical protein